MKWNAFLANLCTINQLNHDKIQDNHQSQTGSYPRSESQHRSDHWQWMVDLKSMTEKLDKITNMNLHQTEYPTEWIEDHVDQTHSHDHEHLILDYIDWVSSLKNPSSQEWGLLGCAYLTINFKNLEIHHIKQNTLRNLVEKFFYNISNSKSQFITKPLKELSEQLLKEILIEDMIVKKQIRLIHPIYWCFLFY